MSLFLAAKIHDLFMIDIAGPFDGSTRRQSMTHHTFERWRPPLLSAEMKTCPRVANSPRILFYFCSIVSRAEI